MIWGHIGCCIYERSLRCETGIFVKWQMHVFSHVLYRTINIKMQVDWVQLHLQCLYCQIKDRHCNESTWEFKGCIDLWVISGCLTQEYCSIAKMTPLIPIALSSIKRTQHNWFNNAVRKINVLYMMTGEVDSVHLKLHKMPPSIL